VPPGVAEVLAYRRARKRRKILQGSGVGGVGGDYDGVVHSALLLQGINDRRHSRAFLTHSNVDAIHRVAFVVVTALIYNSIYRNGGLAGLPVADEQFALPATDRYHRVNGLDTGLKRLIDRLSEDDLRRLAL